MNRDRVFLIALTTALAVIVLFGIGSVVVSLSLDDHDVKTTAGVIGAIQAMFGVTVAFGVAYLVRRNGKNGPNG